MGFEIIESGDEQRPWAVWDRLEGCPWDHYETRHDAAMAILRIEWEMRRK